MCQINIYPQWVTENLVNAGRDYLYLLNRRFPERGVLKLVGDRYRLSGDERTVLYRGIASEVRSVLRRNLVTIEMKGKRLVIDGYNVLFTLLNYRLGRIMFISTDGILRDAGALHGRLKEENTFEACVDLLINYLLEEQPEYTEIYLDSPVSHSERHSRFISERFADKGIPGTCSAIKSADWALKNSKECIIATSDTAIIENASLPVADLPVGILTKAYSAKFVSLPDLLAPDQIENSVDKG